MKWFHIHIAIFIYLFITRTYTYFQVECLCDQEVTSRVQDIPIRISDFVKELDWKQSVEPGK